MRDNFASAVKKKADQNKPKEQRLAEAAGWSIALEYSNGTKTIFTKGTEDDFMEIHAASIGKQAWVFLWNKAQNL